MMRIKNILLKSLREPLNDSEQALLNEWLEERAAHRALLEELNDSKRVADAMAILEQLSPETAWNKISDNPYNEKTIPLYRTWVGRVAAIFILVMAGVGALYLWNKETDTTLAKLSPKEISAPATNRAAIQLANGKTVYLDSVGNGQLAMEGGMQLVKLDDGKIAYQNAQGKILEGENIFNTLTNPNGSRPIDIALADGSHVWLNAGSSITYPVSFARNADRKVNMTGEAYFEIAKRNGVGFVVQKGDLSVRVLGTHFNIKAYENEPNLKVTLVEGSVRVQVAGQNALLKPGQQALVQSSVINVLEDADIDEVLAWKNGRTIINEADVAAVLLEIERWFNIKTELKGKNPGRRFYVNVNRNGSLADLLQVLEENKIKYEYDAALRKLTVTP